VRTRFGENVAAAAKDLWNRYAFRLLDYSESRSFSLCAHSSNKADATMETMGWLLVAMAKDRARCTSEIDAIVQCTYYSLCRVSHDECVSVCVRARSAAGRPEESRDGDGGARQLRHFVWRRWPRTLPQLISLSRLLNLFVCSAELRPVLRADELGSWYFCTRIGGRTRCCWTRGWSCSEKRTS
jgi:hypothetical protein